MSSEPQEVRSEGAGEGEDPHRIYRDRLHHFEDRDAQLERRSILLSAFRLVTVAAWLVMLWLATKTTVLAADWALVPVLVFVVLMAVHRRVAAAQGRARRCAALYQAGLARLEDRWVGQGATGEQFRDPAHVYAADLDIFGRGSLFELLCTVRSSPGEQALARWLLQSASPEEVAERQQAVAELRGRIDLRERLAVLADEAAACQQTGRLERWGAAPAQPVPAILITVALALPMLELLVTVAWLGLGWSGWWVVLLILLHSAFGLRQRRWIRSVIGAVDRPARELRLLCRLLAVIEDETFSAASLQDLRTELQTGGAPPSRHIARLQLIVELLDSRRNIFFAPIAAYLCWTFHLACAIERWRRRCGRSLAPWLAALGRFEALLALATFAYEHPRDPFPELLSERECEGAPLLEAIGIVHPIIPAGQAVRNDLRLDQQRRVLVVSGSNMSGKTTLLRTLGTNLVLAQAGAPVRAHRLRCTPLAIGASIATLDSLLEGRSRFFTEITRLKRIVDLCDGRRTVLFLLDEILHGTNSHERRIGAELLVQGLLERQAVGLLTTHDLALAELSVTLAPRVENIHFEDRMEDGKLQFDYRLRPGTVTRSNALELMRLVGLPVSSPNRWTGA